MTMCSGHACAHSCVQTLHSYTHVYTEPTHQTSVLCNLLHNVSTLIDHTIYTYAYIHTYIHTDTPDKCPMQPSAQHIHANRPYYIHICIHTYIHTHTHQTSALCNLLHSAAMRLGHNQYINPVSGEAVYTAKYLKTRSCCGKSCRHCPHKNLSAEGKKPFHISTESSKYVSLPIDEARLTADSNRRLFSYSVNSPSASFHRSGASVVIQGSPSEDSAASSPSSDKPPAPARTIKHPYSKSGGKFSFSMDDGKFW
jgi:hypothetical protein